MVNDLTRENIMLQNVTFDLHRDFDRGADSISTS